MTSWSQACPGRSQNENVCSSGTRAICSGTICSANTKMNSVLAPGNLIHANA